MTPVNLSRFSNRWYKPGNVGKTDSGIGFLDAFIYGERKRLRR
jgi:hypothetical protein